MKNSTINITQNLMDEVYNKWNTPECKSINRLEIINKFFTPKHKAAVQLGNMNYQVENGGWSQWHFNGYSEDLEDLIEIAKKGVSIRLKNFKMLLEMLIKINNLGDPSDYNDTEQNKCYECGGSGEIEEYNEG